MIIITPFVYCLQENRKSNTPVDDCCAGKILFLLVRKKNQLGDRTEGVCNEVTLK